MRDLPSTLASAVQAWKYAGKKEILDYSDRDVSVIIALESGAPTPVFVDGQRESMVRYVSGVTGGSASDSLSGDRWNNTLQGRDGDDWLRGKGGSDIMDGGPGRDVLAGGSGADILTGGSGADRFVYGRVSDTKGDIITDFSHAQGDVIQFVFADSTLPASVQSGFVPDSEHPLPLPFHGSVPAAHSLWYEVAGDGHDLALYGDTDGHTETHEVSLVLQGVTDLQASDIVFQYGSV